MHYVTTKLPREKGDTRKDIEDVKDSGETNPFGKPFYVFIHDEFLRERAQAMRQKYIEQGLIAPR